MLANEDVSLGGSKWSTLIEISIDTGKIGRAIDREELRAKLKDRSFCFAGD